MQKLINCCLYYCKKKKYQRRTKDVFLDISQKRVGYINEMEKAKLDI